MRAFYKALIKNPRAISAITPSSTYLSQAVAHFIPQVDGFIVELGGGTGVITHAILQEKKICSERFIVVDNAKTMLNTLRKRFPNINVIDGDARQLPGLLRHLALPVDVIISSLPLLSFAPEDREKIIHGVETTLQPSNGYFIQFTYGITKSLFDSNPRFTKIKSKIIWRNLPPARVDIFQVNSLKI